MFGASGAAVRFARPARPYSETAASQGAARVANLAVVSNMPGFSVLFVLCRQSLERVTPNRISETCDCRPHERRSN